MIRPVVSMQRAPSPTKRALHLRSPAGGWEEPVRSAATPGQDPVCGVALLSSDERTRAERVHLKSNPSAIIQSPRACAEPLRRFRHQAICRRLPSSRSFRSVVGEIGRWEEQRNQREPDRNHSIPPQAKVWIQVRCSTSLPSKTALRAGRRVSRDPPQTHRLRLCRHTARRTKAHGRTSGTHRSTNTNSLIQKRK